MDTTQARSVVEDVLTRVAPEADLSAVDPDADLRRELDLDSMDFLTLVEGLHDATGVDVDEDDYPRVRTLNGAVTFLVERST